MKRQDVQQHDGSDVAFLIGAGRSGTTLLYKLLCLHPKVAYVSNYEKKMQWLPAGWASRLSANLSSLKLKAWFKHGNAYFVSRPWAKRLVPTPIEGEFMYAASGIPLVPRAQYVPNETTRRILSDRFEIIRVRSKAMVFISKRTANNRRIHMLREIFPAAKYIHLIRDGRDVAHSLSQVDWWDDHVLWWDGRKAKDAESSGHERLSLCAQNWVNEISELKAGLTAVPQRQVLELRYEDLLDDPASQLQRILEFLEVPATTSYLSAISSLQLSGRNSEWPKVWSDDQLAGVLQVEQSTLRQLGYVK